MANGNFVVQNGLTVGPLTINATTGDITTTGNITSTSSVSNEAVNTLSANVIVAGSSSGNVSVTANVLPSANVTYSLGSRTQMWKDVFVGPGTLYVNGKAVIQDNSGTITFSTDANQNLQIATSGSGDLQFVTSTGAISLQGPIKVTAGKYFTSSDGNAIGFSNQIAVDALTSKSSNTDLVLTAQGTGKVQVNDDMAITGNLTITGTTTTVNTTTLSVADNIIDLNSDVTTGTPSEDAGIRVLRGDSAAVQLKWSESQRNWQLTTDGSTYANIVTTSGGGGSVTFGAFTTGALTSSSLQATAIGNVTPGTGAFTTLSASSTVSGTGFSTYLASPPAIGGTAAAAGTFTTLTASTSLTTPSITKSGTNGSGDIGQSNNTFATVYATTFSGVSTTAKYADLAENYQADKTYAPGTVVMLGGEQEVTVADADSKAVVGVVSTNPAHLMNGGLSGPNVVAVALQGRVPCMVIGPVKKGDILVSAGYGYAKASANPQIGQVIGKALYDFPGSTKAVMEIVVGRV
jgi:hypothetical protein